MHHRAHGRAHTKEVHELRDGKVITGVAVLVEWGRSHDEAEAAPVTEALAIDVWLWGEITADVGSPSCCIGV